MALTRATQAEIVSSHQDRGGSLLRELLHLLGDLGARRWLAEALELAAITLSPTEDLGIDLGL